MVTIHSAIASAMTTGAAYTAIGLEAAQRKISTVKIAGWFTIRVTLSEESVKKIGQAIEFS